MNANDYPAPWWFIKRVLVGDNDTAIAVGGMFPGIPIDVDPIVTKIVFLTEDQFGRKAVTAQR